MLKKSIPYNMILTAVENDAMDTLAYWVQLKSKFKKPIFYNYSKRSIARLLDCHATTATKHIKNMISLGWANNHNSNLCLTGVNKLNKTMIIRVPVCKRKSEQVAQLRFVLLKNNTDKQAKQICKKNEIVKKAKTTMCKLSISQIKKAREVGGIEKLESSIQNRITLSNNSIGLLYNRSSSSGSRYQIQFNDMGMMKSEAKYLKSDYDQYLMGSGAFISSGSIFKRTSNTFFIPNLGSQAIVPIKK